MYVREMGRRAYALHPNSHLGVVRAEIHQAPTGRRRCTGLRENSYTPGRRGVGIKAPPLQRRYTPSGTRIHATYDSRARIVDHGVDHVCARPAAHPTSHLDVV